jgi:hypothetical protein
MAEHRRQQQDFRQGQQHLANRNQEASATPVVIIHQQQGLVNQRQVALAEVGLEAHLQYHHLVQHQQAK